MTYSSNIKEILKKGFFYFGIIVTIAVICAILYIALKSPISKLFRKEDDDFSIPKVGEIDTYDTGIDSEYFVDTEIEMMEYTVFGISIPQWLPYGYGFQEVSYEILENKDIVVQYEYALEGGLQPISFTTEYLIDDKSDRTIKWEENYDIVFVQNKEIYIYYTQKDNQTICNAIYIRDDFVKTTISGPIDLETMKRIIYKL